MIRQTTHLLGPFGQLRVLTDGFNLVRYFLASPFRKGPCFTFTLVFMSDTFASTGEGLPDRSTSVIPSPPWADAP